MKNQILLVLALFIQYAGVSQSKSGKIDKLLKAHHANNQFNGSVLVLQKGKIIFESGYGYRDAEAKKKNNTNTIFQVGSVTKQFTALVMLKLEEEGKLELTDLLSKYYPAFPGADSITMHHLLSHSSGVPNYTDDEKFMQDEITRPVDELRMFALFRKGLDFIPGSKFKYSNSGYYILGSVIQKVTGQSYEQVIREMIFQPLGMDRSGFDFAHLTDSNKAIGYSWIDDDEQIRERLVDSSVSFSAGSIYSTLGDLLKWHDALMKNKILSRHSLEKAFTVYKEGFGYGWVMDSVYNKKIVYHNGSILGFTSNIYRVESDNTIIIILNNINNRQIDKITSGILSVLYEQPYPIPEVRLVIDLAPDSVKKYLGIYEFNPEFKLKIFSELNKIYAQKLGETEKFRIYYYQPNRFFLKKMDAQLEFAQGKDNSSITLILHQSGKQITGIRRAD